MPDATEYAEQDHPHEPPGGIASGIVRCDHVIVGRRGILGPLGLLAEGGFRGCWLVLTDSREVRLYQGRKPPDFTKTFRLLASSPDQLRAKRGRLLRWRWVNVRFGDKRRRIYFDGRHKGASRIATYLVMFLGELGHVIELVHGITETATLRKRRRDARNAWLPALRGGDSVISGAEAPE